MSLLVGAVVIFIVVPLQVTWLHYVEIGEIRPDICLALACLVGFLRNERQGFLFGLGIGFAQDLASSGALWLNLLTKGAGGLVAGLVGRRLVQPTVLSFVILVLGVSAASGILFLLTGRTVGSWAEELPIVRLVLFPRAAYDSVVAAGLYWLFARHLAMPGQAEESGTGAAHVLSVK